MSGVDDRIVSMKFDNAVFERKIRETLKSLASLRKSLDDLGASKGIKQLSDAAKQFDVSNVIKQLQSINTASKNVDLSNVAASLQTISAAANQMRIEPAIDALGGITAAAQKVDTSAAGEALQDVTDSAGRVRTDPAVEAMGGVTSGAEDVDTSGATEAMQDVTAGADRVDASGATEAFDQITIHAANVDVSGAVKGLQSVTSAANQIDTGGATKAMQSLTNTANAVDLTAIARGIENISGKFTALNVVAGAALFQLATTALHFGAQIVKSLSLGPIMQGFQEYETNMNSIQTILANTKSKGSTLADVNQALDQMNEYSDKTIYNFSEMARNVGTFTAAGVGLKDSVDAIKGIANLAAISGSNAGQAATAMYQLSQALAAGKVSLMDWTSVVNAGMGGEIFKKALFETGKALKTINDVPLDTTFEQWEKSGGTFREQMQEGWITAEVLRTTLGGFSGEMDAAAFSAMGFSDAAAQQMEDLGKLGVAAATEVKTATQLMGTIREAIGSGWSMTYRKIVGDFGEAKKLFTNINNAISKFIGDSAEARNNMIDGWRFLGGREVLIQGFTDALKGLGAIMTEVKEAFREFFPKTTGFDLALMTKHFADFIAQARPTAEAMNNIKETFRGVFAALSIGWEVVKQTIGLFADLFRTLTKGAGTGLFEWTAGFADGIVKMREFLVTGGGLARFFDKVREALTGFIEAIRGPNGLGAAVDGAKTAVGAIGDAGETVASAWDRVAKIFGNIKHALDGVLGEISKFFDDFKTRVKDAITPDDMNPVLDAVNVGLLGGLVLMFRKFLKNGIKLDITGGFMQQITAGLTQLTETLKAMQTEIKARALQKIAIAIGILAAAIFVLSTIEPGELSATLTAMGAGLGELLGAMAVINSLGMSPVKLNAIAISMNLIATAMVTFALAVRALAGLGWEELGRGLAGVSASLGLMIGATYLISKDPGGLIRTGIALNAMAIAMRILAEAVQAFGTMSWGELAHGLTGMGVALGVIVVAMKLMPTSQILAAGLAMIPLATGLGLLSVAVMSFATMDWGEMGKGIAGVAGSLVVIAGAMRLMPLTLPITAAGLVLVGLALNEMALALRVFGGQDLGSMAKGLGAMAAMLAILAVAVNAMNGAILGAAALTIVTAALFGLTVVLHTLGNLAIAQIVTGLAALAGIFAIVGGGAILLSSAIVPLLAFGAALTLIGAAMFLFGTGANLLAKAFKTIGELGGRAFSHIIDGSKALIVLLPALAKAAAVALGEFLVAVIKVLGEVVKQATPLVAGLFKLLDEAVKGIIMVIKRRIGGFIEIGFQIIMTLIKGIRDNIGEFLTMAIEIMVTFAEGLIQNMPMLMDTAVRLIMAFLTELTMHAAELVAAGLGLLVALLEGLAQNIGSVTEAAANLIVVFLAEIAASMLKIVSAGVNILLWLLRGISENLVKVVAGVAEIVLQFIGALADKYSEIIEAGLNLLVNFLLGIGQNMILIANTVGDIIAAFIWSVGANMTKIVTAGAEAIISFLSGLEKEIPRVIAKGTDVIIAFIKGITENAIRLADAAFTTLTTFLHELATVIEKRTPELMDAGWDVAKAIVKGVVKGIKDNSIDVWNAVLDMAKKAWDKVKGFFDIFSPSKKFAWLGEMLMKGMANGIDKNADLSSNSAVQAAEGIVKAFHKSLSEIPEGLPGVDISPTIAPVLDLTQVQAAARGLDALLAVNAIVPEVSIDRARQIATTADLTKDGAAQAAPVYNEYHYEQVINSPTALSTSDIYRNTKSLIAIEKEELGI